MADEYDLVDARVFLERPRPEDVARMARELSNGSVPVSNPARFRGLTLAELRARPAPAYVVEGYLQADSLAVLEGIDGSYKTFLALAWAHAVALAQPWFGHAVHGGRVLYVLGEGSRGLPRRADAWQIVQLQERQDVPDLLFVVDEMPQLWQGDASQVVAANPGPFVLVVVDTLARAMVGGNENQQQDMGLFVAGCDQLRRAYDGACVLSLHHLNAVGRTRGSTSLPGAISTKLRLERRGATRTVTLSVPKQRDDEPQPPMELVARTVELGGLDEHGRPETSLVLEALTDPVSVPASDRLNHAEQVALDALPYLNPYLYAAWRDASGLAKSSFDDARRSLVKRGFVQHQPNGSYQRLAEVRTGTTQVRMAEPHLGHAGRYGEVRESLEDSYLRTSGPYLPEHTNGDLPW